MKIKSRIISLLLVMVLMVSIVPVSAFAKGDIAYGVAWTTGSNLRLRSGAGTGTKVVDTAPRGEVVLVLNKQGDWYRVIYNQQVGYMHGDYLNVQTKENVELGYGKINGTNVNLRSGAGTSYSAVAKGNTGDKAYIIGINEGWYKVIFGSKICYIRSDYLDLTEIPYENEASTNAPKFFENGKSTGVAPSASALKGTGNSDSTNNSNSSNNSSNSNTNNNTNNSNGNGNSGFDCSGFVYYVYNSLGIKISRTQATMYAKGTVVSKSELQPGDIVFFQNTYKSGISHCGIYVGEGRFIHSPSSGGVVSYASLNSDYYTAHWYGACRYI